MSAPCLDPSCVMSGRFAFVLVPGEHDVERLVERLPLDLMAYGPRTFREVGATRVERVVWRHEVRWRARRRERARDVGRGRMRRSRYPRARGHLLPRRVRVVSREARMSAADIITIGHLRCAQWPNVRRLAASLGIDLPAKCGQRARRKAIVRVYAALRTSSRP